MRKNEVWTGEVRILKQTPKAILCSSEEGEKPFWIPLSQIRGPEDYEFTTGEEIEISIPLWLAEEKDLV